MCTEEHDRNSVLTCDAFSVDGERSILSPKSGNGDVAPPNPSEVENEERSILPPKSGNGEVAPPNPSKVDKSRKDVSKK